MKSVCEVSSFVRHIRDQNILSMTASAAVAFFLWTSSPAAWARVWIVDDDGPADFAEIQDAITHAKNGDTILVRPGEYDGFTIVQKGLKIIGAGKDKVTIRGGPYYFLQIYDLNGVSELYLSGFTGIGLAATSYASDNHGLIVMSDVVATNEPGVGNVSGPDFFYCDRCFLSRLEVVPDGILSASGYLGGLGLYDGKFALSGCSVTGDEGGYSLCSAGKGDTGISAGKGRHYIARTSCYGGVGGITYWFDYWDQVCPCRGGAGGYGFVFSGDSTAIVAGDGSQVFQGGEGGESQFSWYWNCWTYSGDGGNALWIYPDPGKKRLVLSGMNLVPGMAGYSPDANKEGEDGIAIEGDASVIETPDFPIPTLEASGDFRPAGNVRLRYFGTPGDYVLTFVSSEFGFQNVKGIAGFPLHALPGGEIFRISETGLIPQGGVLDLDFPLPDDDDLVGLILCLQGVTFPTSGSPPGSPAHLTNFDTIAIHENL